MVNLGINSIFMARNGVVELIPVLEELSYLCAYAAGINISFIVGGDGPYLNDL